MKLQTLQRICSPEDFGKSEEVKAREYALVRRIYEEVRVGPYPYKRLEIRVGEDPSLEIPDGLSINFWNNRPIRKRFPEFGRAHYVGRTAFRGTNDPLFIFRMGSKFHKMIASSKAPAFEYNPQSITAEEGEMGETGIEDFEYDFPLRSFRSQGSSPPTIYAIADQGLGGVLEWFDDPLLSLLSQLTR